MRALLLAAGEGTRLRPLTLDKPKPMLPIAGRPLLEHLVVLLREHGIREIAINLHYRPESIQSHFGDGRWLGVDIVYSHEERLLGSAGAAKRLESFLNETFLVLYGDVLTDIDLTALVAEHRARSAMLTLALREVEDPERCGIVQLEPGGRVSQFIEKPRSREVFGRLANAGVYVVEPSVLNHVPEGVPSDFGNLFPLLLAKGLPIYGSRLSGYVLDVGSPERYAQAQDDVAAGLFKPAGSALASQVERR